MGSEIGQTFQQNLTSNPFTLRYYRWKKYNFIDHALKNPRICISIVGFGLVGAFIAYQLANITYRWTEKQPVFYAIMERPWLYVNYERDSRKPRGNPDCGKDFKPKYFA